MEKKIGKLDFEFWIPELNLIVPYKIAMFWEKNVSEKTKKIFIEYNHSDEFDSFIKHLYNKYLKILNTQDFYRENGYESDNYWIPILKKEDKILEKIKNFIELNLY